MTANRDFRMKFLFDVKRKCLPHYKTQLATISCFSIMEFINTYRGNCMKRYFDVDIPKAEAYKVLYSSDILTKG